MNEIKSPVSKDTRADQSVRPKRVPLGSQARLTIGEKVVNKRDFQPRWINDKGDRIQRALEGGYEFVESEEEAGIPKVAEATKIGKRLSKSVGGGITAYLMQIPRTFYEEDQAEKQKKVDELERQMKPQKAKEEYGEGLTNE